MGSEMCIRDRETIVVVSLCSVVVACVRVVVVLLCVKEEKAQASATQAAEECVKGCNWV